MIVPLAGTEPSGWSGPGELSALEKETLARANVIHLNTARTWRGGEQQVLYLSRLIHACGGHEVVVGAAGGQLGLRCAAELIPFRPLRMFAEFDLLAARKIARIARETGANILHTHTAKAHGLALFVKRLLPDLKLVVSRRVDFHMKQTWFSRRKYLNPLIDMYLAISDNVRRILIEDGIDPSHIRIAYSGIDVDRLSVLPDKDLIRHEFNIRPDEILFGNVAALVDHKDQITLLRAVAQMKEDGLSGFRVIIVGEGELRRMLEAETARLGVSRLVIFAGFRTDVPAFLSAFDVFVMSSKEEGLGTAVLDAMAAGLPVACTDGGGLPEMIEQEKGGLLGPAQNAKALAASMAVLLSDSARRLRFGTYNRSAVARFSYQSTFRMTLAAYAELLQVS